MAVEIGGQQSRTVVQMFEAFDAMITRHDYNKLRLQYAVLLEYLEIAHEEIKTLKEKNKQLSRLHAHLRGGV